MHIDTVPNRNSRPTYLLRESYRVGKKVRKRTIANLSKLPLEQIELIRQVLKGQKLAPLDDLFQILPSGSRQHGHVHAVLSAMKRLRFANLVSSRSSRERQLVVGMVASLIAHAQSKLAMSVSWHTTTLPETLEISDADEDDLYEAMDWLLDRQERIEEKLARRHLANGCLALYDLTSSYFEGSHCPLAARGHNRDKKAGKLQVNYGVLANRDGCPVAVSVFAGNTGDPATLPSQIKKLRGRFELRDVVIVGDRGMITAKQVRSLRQKPGIDWITALRPEAIRKLVRGGLVQMGLFDERNIFELRHPEFPGERLIACRNAEMQRRRAKKRESLIEATKRDLEKVRKMVNARKLRGKKAIEQRLMGILNGYKIRNYYRLSVTEDTFSYKIATRRMNADIAKQEARMPEVGRIRQRCQKHMNAIAKKFDGVRLRIKRGRIYGKDAIGVRVGKVLNNHRVGKHFQLDISDSSLEFKVDQENVAAEAALDGIYVVHTSLPKEKISAPDAVRSYKQLSRVEEAFRCMKTMSLRVRPIRHRLSTRVRAHIFLMVLAYYVEWHMREAWRPLLYSDEDQASKVSRDPVAPAKRSDAALRKVQTKRLPDGSHVQSFETLMLELSTIVRNKCRRKSTGAYPTPSDTTFDVDTPPNAAQRRALKLLDSIAM